MVRGAQVTRRREAKVNSYFLKYLYPPNSGKKKEMSFY